ncbi:MAG: lipoyl(octanoyl) transferase LipB [Ignavibacteriales bacterium]|nr:lipoyl(octanoyl) transferase LipB [Ignavibacteriales bacterium]
MQIGVVNIGRSRYEEAWKLQKTLLELRHFGLTGDLFVLTEHEHVYTLGKGADGNHLLASEQELREGGAEVFQIDRGGDITYHGPGQVVGYPILDLSAFKTDIHWYLRSLEETIILALEEFGIEAEREEGMTGVWVKGEKIAALGIKVSRWITMHGFALNVNTDLRRFDRIIPCGIFHKGVTSMQQLLGRPVPLNEVHGALIRSFAVVFGRNPVQIEASTLRQLIETHALQTA